MATDPIPPPHEPFTDNEDATKQGKCKDVWYRYLAGVAGAVGALRRDLTEDTNFYLRTDGSDENDGLTNTAAGAFLTLQGAIDSINANWDLRGHTLTLNIADGTYTGASSVLGRFTGQYGAGNFVITGGSGAILTSNSGGTLTIAHSGAGVRMTGGITIQNNANAFGVRIADCAYAELGNITWGNCGTSVHLTVAMGAGCFLFDDYTIAGNASIHIGVQGNAVLEMYDLTVTASGSRAFSDAFAYLFDGGQIQTAGMTYSGTFTGKRFHVADPVSHIETFSSGLTYLPGDAAGTFGTGGGVYDGILRLGTSGTEFKHYEEGTWTVGVTFGGSASGVTFSSRSGRYTRIGNVVVANFYVDLSSNGSGTGAALITGLPFTTASDPSGAGSFKWYNNFAALTGPIVLDVAGSGTTIALNQGTTSGVAALTEANILDTASFRGLITYHTT